MVMEADGTCLKVDTTDTESQTTGSTEDRSGSGSSGHSSDEPSRCAALEEMELRDDGRPSEGAIEISAPFQQYPFHHANIHERRLAAYVARSMPLTILLVTVFLTAIGFFKYRLCLLITAAFLNVWMWCWIVSYAISTLWSTRVSRRKVLAAEKVETDHMSVEASPRDIVHLIILPNYKEDESIMARTLEALTEAHGSKDFRIVLAVEEREGAPAQERSRHLQDRFDKCFARLSVATHPRDLEQKHSDGSVNPEIPGKSSNLKWAVHVGYTECVEDGFCTDSIVLTVADADCIFHPQYFAEVGKDFAKLRHASSCNLSTSDHLWSMWQAPQLPFRNLMACPAPSRVWGYLATIYEFGGVGSLACGGYHMTFSSFSLPLELVLMAMPWDGDVIADDHHNYLRCFLYSVFHQVSDAERLSKFGCCGKGANPPLRLRPVMLPVKTTSVLADNCWQGWKARFEQAKRHAQGVAEFCYILLGVWDLLRTLPLRAYSCSLLLKLCRVVLLPFCINMLPIIQAVPFGVVTFYWYINGQEAPECPASGPDSVFLKFDDPQFYLCMFSGGLSLGGVPSMIPMVLFVLASYCMTKDTFLEPISDRAKSQADQSGAAAQTVSGGTVWQREDGEVRPTCGSRKLTLLLAIIIDVLVFMPLVMPIYGGLAFLRAYLNVLIRGNNFKFVSASKVGKPAEPHLIGKTAEPASQA